MQGIFISFMILHGKKLTPHEYHRDSITTLLTGMYFALTHWGRATHICISKPTITGSDNGLSPVPASSHYLNQWWNIVNWTLRNKLQWDFNQNSYIFIQEKVFENVVCEIAAILSRPQCVDCSIRKMIFVSECEFGPLFTSIWNCLNVCIVCIDYTLRFSPVDVILVESSRISLNNLWLYT